MAFAVLVQWARSPCDGDASFTANTLAIRFRQNLCANSKKRLGFTLRVSYVPIRIELRGA